MAVERIIASVLIFFHFQWATRCDFASIGYYSKDLTFQASADGQDDKLIVVSTPESGAYSKHFYFSYIECNLSSKECEARQDCFNCPKSYEAKRCHFRSPHNDSLPLGQVSLRPLGDYDEHVVVDWASEAVLNASLEYSRGERRVQVISMEDCLVRDIPLELSLADNGMRRLLLDALPTTRSLDAFYIDYRACGDSGWVRARYSEDGQPAGGPECVSGLERSKPKFAMDAIAGAGSSAIALDKNEDHWVLYELRNRSDRASELHRGANGGLFDVARLDRQADDFGSLCWLADVEPAYSLNCTVFRAEPRYVRELRLDFHYAVRDFELRLADFKRVYALTSSADDEDGGCAYDLWIFDVRGRPVDGPLRVQGPRCARAHRLRPRPRLALLSRDEVCASFAFERPMGHGRAGRRQRRFALLTECFAHSD